MAILVRKRMDPRLVDALLRLRLYGMLKAPFWLLAADSLLPAPSGVSSDGTRNLKLGDT